MLYFVDDVMELSSTMTVIVSALVIPLIIAANFSSRYLIIIYIKTPPGIFPTESIRIQNI